MPSISRTETPACVDVVAPLHRSERGVSGSFLVRASDENRYWCKVVNNPAGAPRIPINEQIAGRLGMLLQVAVCPVELIRIPEALAGQWEFHPGRLLEAGWAHGSLAVDGVVETRAMEHRSDDDNKRRHAGFYALHDWLGGQDTQWLMCGDEGNAYYSHDHGHYFPGGPSWTVDALRAHGTSSSELAVPAGDLDPKEITRLADRLDAVTEAEVCEVMSTLPTGWPITDGELEALVEFLLQRRAGAAGRLRAKLGNSP